MVCSRCTEAVESIFKGQGITIKNIQLGEVIVDEITDIQILSIESDLNQKGFEILKEKNSVLIQKVKNIIIDHIEFSNKLKEKFSVFLSKKIGYDYSYISRIFSSNTGYTIEKYFSMQRIEKTKELIKYDELNLSEIAYKLNYSSVAHLSKQFKQVTGMSPSEFKKQQNSQRKGIDQIWDNFINIFDYYISFYFNSLVILYIKFIYID